MHTKGSLSAATLTPAYSDEKLRQGFIDLGIDPDHPQEGLLVYYASTRYEREEDPQYFASPTLHEAPTHPVVIDMPIAMGRNEVTRAKCEYAARTGTTTRFAQGDTLTLDQANFMVAWANVKDGAYEWDYDFGSTHELLPVDRLDAANAWGLRHMSGNVSEFTSTCGSEENYFDIRALYRTSPIPHAPQAASHSANFV